MSEAKEGPYRFRLEPTIGITGPGLMGFGHCVWTEGSVEEATDIANIAFAQGRQDLAKKFEKWLRDIDSPNWPSRKEMLAKLDELVGK